MGCVASVLVFSAVSVLAASLFSAGFEMRDASEGTLSPASADMVRSGDWTKNESQVLSTKGKEPHADGEIPVKDTVYDLRGGVGEFQKITQNSHALYGVVLQIIQASDVIFGPTFHRQKGVRLSKEMDHQNNRWV